MQASYYPGCSLEATARDYQESIDGVAELLGLELKELDDWNCCGASAAHSLDHKAALNLSARNLGLAVGGPQPLVVPCALCFNRLKSAQYELAADTSGLVPSIAKLTDDWQAVEILELNRFLTEGEMAQQILDKAEVSLRGIKPVCYYGCQGQRPPRVTGHPAHENPTGMERLLGALGAEVIDWPFKTDCCGASHTASRPDLVFDLVGHLYAEALDRGADCIVTGCQMCQANLDLYQTEIADRLGREVYLPVFYLTELIGLALGHDRAGRWLKRHMVSPEELLTRTPRLARMGVK
jgi:heterodisulfide reductase subunit B